MGDKEGTHTGQRHGDGGLDGVDWREAAWESRVSFVSIVDILAWVSIVDFFKVNYTTGATT